MHFDETQPKETLMARSGTLLNRLTKIYRVIYSRTILHLTWHCFIAKASSLLTKALNKESAIQYLTAVDNPTSLRCISLGTNCRVFFHMSGIIEGFYEESFSLSVR